MPSTSSLIIGIITGAIGLGYFIYGRKRDRIMFAVSGISLMGYSYMVSSFAVLVIVGMMLLTLPFIIKA